METTWSSEPIHLADGMLIAVHATDKGVSVGKQVDGIYASDTLYAPEQAKQLAAALIEGAARSLAMRNS